MEHSGTEQKSQNSYVKKERKKRTVKEATQHCPETFLFWAFFLGTQWAAHAGQLPFHQRHSAMTWQHLTFLLGYLQPAEEVSKLSGGHGYLNAGKRCGWVTVGRGGRGVWGAHEATPPYERRDWREQWGCVELCGAGDPNTTSVKSMIILYRVQFIIREVFRGRLWRQFPSLRLWSGTCGRR